MVKILSNKLAYMLTLNPGLSRSLSDTEQISQSPIWVTKSPGYEGKMLQIQVFTVILADFGEEILKYLTQ